MAVLKLAASRSAALKADSNQGLVPVKKHPNWGGARPGSGVKPKNVIDWRRRMEQTFAKHISDEDVGIAVKTWMAAFKAGDKDALWLVDRIFGKVRDEALIEFRGALAIKYVNDWREQG